MALSVHEMTDPPGQSGKDQCTRQHFCKKKDAQKFLPQELSDLLKYEMKC